MDIDLVVDPTDDQLRSLVAALPRDRFYVSLDAALEARRRESLFNVIDAESGWKVDLIQSPLRHASLNDRTGERSGESLLAPATYHNSLMCDDCHRNAAIRSEPMRAEFWCLHRPCRRD
jgi:hypothetical protein